MNDDSPSLASVTVPGWITEQQLAQHLQVSTRHLINLRRAGLPFIQLGSSVRYDLHEVEAFVRGKRRLSSHVERQRRRKAIAAKSRPATPCEVAGCHAEHSETPTPETPHE